MKICRKCGSRVKKEKDKELKKEYKYYCGNCDENLYSIEVEKVPLIVYLRSRKPKIHITFTENKDYITYKYLMEWQDKINKGEW